MERDNTSIWIAMHVTFYAGALRYGTDAVEEWIE